MTNQWPSLGPATVLATCAVHGDIQFDARRVVVLLDRTPAGALYPCDLCGHVRLVPIGGVSTAVLIGGGAQVVKPLARSAELKVERFAAALADDAWPARSAQG